MPIYEYRCRDCGHRFERLVPRAQGEAPACPRCAGRRAERLLSAFAVTGGGRERPAPGPCGSDDCACRRSDDRD